VKETEPSPTSCSSTPRGQGLRAAGRVARLAGCLRAHGVGCTVLDANLEGQLDLLGEAGKKPGGNLIRGRAGPGAGSRASRPPQKPGTLQQSGPLPRCVNDVNRLLHGGGGRRACPSAWPITRTPVFPLKSGDLFKAAANMSPIPSILVCPQDYGTYRKEQSAIVGLSLNYLSQALCAFSMIGFIRRISPDCHRAGRRARDVVACGGEGRNPFPGLVDHCIAGPGRMPSWGLPESGKAAGVSTAPITAMLPPGLPGSRPHHPLQCIPGLLLAPMHLLPGEGRGALLQPRPGGAGTGGPGALIEAGRPSLVHFLDSTMSPRLLEHLAEHPRGRPGTGLPG